MSSVAVVLAVVSLGVNYSWQPVAEGADEYEYVVRVEPEMVEALQQGAPLAIESNVPAEVGSVRRVRVVLGHGEQPAVPPAASPVEHTVRQPVSDGWYGVPPAGNRYGTAGTSPEIVPSIGTRMAQNPAPGGVPYNPATSVLNGLDTGLNRVGDQLQYGGQQVLDAGSQVGRNLQDAIRQPLTPAPQNGGTASGPFQTLGTVSRDLVRDTRQQIENAGQTIRNVVSGEAPLLGNSSTAAGGYTPSTSAPGTYQPGSYQSGSNQSGSYQPGAYQPGPYPTYGTQTGAAAAGTNPASAPFAGVAQPAGQTGGTYASGANAAPSYQPNSMTGGAAPAAGYPAASGGLPSNFTSNPGPILPLPAYDPYDRAGSQFVQGSGNFAGSSPQNTGTNQYPYPSAGTLGSGVSAPAVTNFLDNIYWRGPQISPTENGYRVADPLPPASGVQGANSLPGSSVLQGTSGLQGTGGFQGTPGGDRYSLPTSTAATTTSATGANWPPSGGSSLDWPRGQAVSAPPLGDASYSQGGFAGGGGTLETVSPRPLGTGPSVPPRDNWNDLERGNGGFASGPSLGSDSLQTPAERDTWRDQGPGISRVGQSTLDGGQDLPSVFGNATPGTGIGIPGGSLDPSATEPPQSARQGLVEMLAISIALVGSLGGNLFLGWSYMDARGKYLSALRKRVRGYTGRDD